MVLTVCLLLVNLCVLEPDSKTIRLPELKDIEKVEVSYYNAKIEWMDDHESHFNVPLAPERAEEILKTLRASQKVELTSWSNQFVEVGTILIKCRNGYYRRICVLQTLNNFEAQFFSFEGKTYSVKRDQPIENSLLEAILEAEQAAKEKSPAK
ncbi:MAG: hypothetical protein U0892_14095 [Pirellulales bacterium]